MFIYYIIIVVNGMRKLNNKGFTLIELVATVVILGMIMVIGGYAVTELINNSKEKEYTLLIKEIGKAVELYYQECAYSGGSLACYYDFDLDGVVIGKDAVLIKNCVNNGFVGDECKYVELYGDVDNNGLINEDDAIYVLYYSMTYDIEPEDFPVTNKNMFFTTLGILVNNGYLNGNATKEDNTKTLINSNTGKNISDCVILVEYDNGFKVSNIGTINGNDGTSCPTNENYNLIGE